MRLGVKVGQWGWTFPELEAGWRAAEDAGFEFVSCWDHAVAAPTGLAAWDAPSLVVAMAGVTQRMHLATHVVNIALRHPFLLASQFAVAQAASGGRVEVGLGVGGATHMAGHVHRALGVDLLPFARRLERLEACCRVFPALWSGETVDEPALGLTHASLGPIAIEPPPIVVGGIGERTMRVAARWADGWNVTGTKVAADYAPLHARMDEHCRDVGRTRPLARSVQLFCEELPEATARRTIDDFERAGATEVVLVLARGATPDDIHRLAAAVR